MSIDDRSTSEMSLSEVLPGAFFPEEQPTRRRGAARAQRKRKKKKRRRSFFVLLLTFAIVGGAVGGAYVFGLKPLIAKLTEPTDYVGAGSGKIKVKIPDGATGRNIAVLLAKDDVVKTEVAFLDAAKKDTRSTTVQPGTYEMRKQMSGAAALKILLDPEARLTLSVTIPEGTRAKDALVRIAKKLQLKQSDVIKASKSGKIGLPAAAKGRLEGFLFPDTYEFGPDVTATEALTAMVQRGDDAFTALNIPEDDLREVVIEASIVEAEAGNQKYMGKVARVLDNRLAKGQKLQLDSTVSYATQKFNVTTTSADRASASRYNTYKYTGLPAGPISNPGEDALEAVISPTEGDWLYFVTTNPSTGETKFSVDEAGHAANVAEFQNWLRTH